MLRLFISSVQKEFTAERRALQNYVRTDALLRRFFDVFLFEDLPASDRRVDDVYLDELGRCPIYVGLFGQQYGNPDPTGLSPTEREFDQATALGKTRFIFVKGADDNGRHPNMASLIDRAGAQLIRKRFADAGELKKALYESLVDYLESHGLVQGRPFEERPCSDATLDDIDVEAVAGFVRRARHERQFTLPERTPVADVLAHLNLLHGDQPTNAGLLLFGRHPQRFIPSAEVRCMHFHGTEVQRPAPSYQVFQGRLFDQVDRATDFVLSVINRSVGTRAESSLAPVAYEIPPAIVREAIVNAVAHRDYSSTAAVQVSVFADRVEVWNPGELPPPLTPERLRGPHSSIARNTRVCEALFLVRFIEKYGTGTLMMIRESVEHALPEPDFEQRGGEFVSTVWRAWLTARTVSALDLNDRQKAALSFVFTNRRIDNASLRQLTGVIHRTASRDLEDLVRKGVLQKVGQTGRGAHYVLAPKQDKNRTNRTSASTAPQRKGLTMGSMGSAGKKSSPTAQPLHKGDKNKTNRTSVIPKRQPKNIQAPMERRHP